MGKVTEQLKAQEKEVPEMPLRFGCGLIAGAFCALGTQWLHNATLTAGRLAAMNETVEAPHYTLVSMRRVYAELGMKMFYLNFPQRMVVIGGASAVLNLTNIFHRPDLHFL